MNRKACAAVPAVLAAVIAAVGLGGVTRRAAQPVCIAIGGGMSADNQGLFKELLAKSDTGRVVVVPFSSADVDGASKSAIDKFKQHRPAGEYVVLPDPS